MTVSDAEKPILSESVGVAPSPPDVVAEDIIRRNMYWSMGAGIIPVPLLDTAALVAVQIKMLRELSDVYGVPFRPELVRSSVGTLLSSLLATGVGAGILGSTAMRGLLLTTPLIGTVLSIATMPAFYAAFTFAVGKVYQQHFASGGTFLTFDPKAVQEHFRRKFDEQRAAGNAGQQP